MYLAARRLGWRSVVRVVKQQEKVTQKWHTEKVHEKKRETGGNLIILRSPFSRA